MCMGTCFKRDCLVSPRGLEHEDIIRRSQLFCIASSSALTPNPCHRDLSPLSPSLFSSTPPPPFCLFLFLFPSLVKSRSERGLYMTLRAIARTGRNRCRTVPVARTAAPGAAQVIVALHPLDLNCMCTEGLLPFSERGRVGEWARCVVGRSLGEAVRENRARVASSRACAPNLSRPYLLILCHQYISSIPSNPVPIDLALCPTVNGDL